LKRVEFRTARRSLAEVELAPRSSYAIGADEANPIQLSGQGVLPLHGRLSLVDGRVQLAPEGTAPLLINGSPTSEPVLLSNGDWVAFGGTLIQVHFAGGGCSGQEQDPAGDGMDVQVDANDLVIGRSAGCGLAIDSPLISREHARLSLHEDAVLLEDLRSTNGTWVNGVRVEVPTPIHPGDRVAFASFVYLFTGTALVPAEAGNRVRIAAQGLSRVVTDRTTGEPRHLLSAIDLVIEPGEFVVIFGTSGSGKSTLLDALNGRRPASSGRITYNGVDLYRSFDLFRAGIGYVPQQDIVHRKIKVRNALRYTARLRLPPDTSTGEIEAIIDAVLEKVGLQEKAELAVDTPEPLSGGQLKRVSLAVELVANPLLLFLDEATSGLDAGTDKRMMRLFASLAADGKTVTCVTHSLENIDACNLVALLHRGQLVYYGPPAEGAAHFGVDRLSDVYEALENESASTWHERFVASPHYQHYVADRVSDLPTVDAASADVSSKRRKRSFRLFDLRQTLTLTRRYVDLLLADRINLLVLLLQAPLIALVVGGVFDTSGEPLEQAAAQSQIAFVLVLSSIWFGCINSAREIVKELPVYLRERSVTVTLAPYLASKLVPLAFLCLIQVASFLAITTLMLDLEGPFLDRLLTLFLSGFAATAMGLAISAFVNSNDKAIAALPLLLIPQFILSNSVVPLSGVIEEVARVLVVAYWGIDAMRATLDPALLALRDHTGAPVIAVTGEWETDLLYLGAQTLGFLVITLIGLKLKDRRA